MKISFEDWPENMRIKNPVSDFYKNLDPEYLINRIENEYITSIHLSGETIEADTKTDWTFGRLQSWYAGRELQNLGNAVDFEIDRKLQNQYRSTPVNRLSFSSINGAYTQTNPYGIYNNDEKK